MWTMPEISIVLPTFNGEKYIRQAIDSILKQTFQDWELIIVNDCSTDNTLQIINAYREIDSRIRVICNSENQKLPCSLNIGFRNSNGKFLTWTSDDNYYLPQALEIMYQYLCDNRKMYMVCAKMNMIDDSNHVIGVIQPYNELQMFYYNCVGACFMYKREVLECLGDYDIELFLVEDYDYWLRVIEQYNYIGYIDQILYAYRTHNNSLTIKKQKEISEKLLSLRRKHFGLLLDKLNSDKSYLCKLFYDFLEMGKNIENIEKETFVVIPELKMDVISKEQNKRVIIWGAGFYGEKAFKILGEKAIYFVDINSDIVGKYKCGLKIISKEEVLKIADNYNILIAVGNEKLYDILHFLFINGIKSCCTYQRRTLYNRKILLTVVVTVFNVEFYIHKCLESIINQTYTQLEIIIIDDGSTDTSGEICDSYAKKDDRIKVYHRENKGLVSARNQGVKEANGDLITFVDADDWVEKDMYENMLADYSDEDMITSGLIYDWKDRRELYFDSFTDGVFDKSSIENTILQQMMYNEKTKQQGITASVCNKIFKVSLLKKIIGLVDSNLTFGEDGAIVYCFVSYSNKIKIINKAWYHYIQHDDSMIRSNDFSTFEKLYRLKNCLLTNLKKSVPAIQMNRQIEYYVKPFLYSAIEDIYKFSTDTVFYLFPYDKVPKNSKIILYGAGKVGYSFWKNIRYGNYVKLVSWVDKKYLLLRKSGLPVEPLESAITKEFDYIVIAIENKKIVQEIRNLLLKYGLEQEKIIFGEIEKITWNS